MYSDNINSPAYQKSREYGVILKVMGTLTFDIVLDIKLDNNTKYLAANATGLIRKDNAISGRHIRVKTYKTDVIGIIKKLAIIANGEKLEKNRQLKGINEIVTERLSANTSPIFPNLPSSENGFFIIGYNK